MSQKISGKNQQAFQHRHDTGINLALMIGVIFLLMLGYLSLQKNLPLWIIGWYVAINIATFLLYAHDKNSAQRGGWRVQESSLHKLALLGGWFGAGIAQKTLRHKSQKAKFRQGFYVTIVGNLILLGLFWYFNLR